MRIAIGRVKVAFIAKENLVRAEDTGPVVQHLAEFTDETIGEGEGLGAWTDDRHVQRKDVPELGQLVQFGTLEEVSDPAQAGIILQREGGARIGAFRTEFAEFVKSESLSAPADAHLREKDWPATLESNGERDDRHDRAEQDQSRQGNRDIKD